MDCPAIQQGNVGCLGAGQKQFRTDCPALQDGCRGMWDVWVRDKSSSGWTALHFRMAAVECGMSGCGTKAVQDGLPCTSGWRQGNVGCLSVGQKQFRTDCPALQDGCRGMSCPSYTVSDGIAPYSSPSSHPQLNTGKADTVEDNFP